MSYNAKNYFAHGGSELVIGGKLTFLPGASVEGIEGLFDIASGEAPGLPYMADSEATTVAALRENFNSLLTALRTVGILAAEPAVVEQMEEAEIADASEQDDAAESGDAP